MQDRVLPVDVGSEQRVLGSMLQTDGGIEAIETVRAILESGHIDYFYKRYHARFFKAMLELHDAGLPVDDLTAEPYQEICTDLQGKRIANISPSEYLEYLRDSTPTAANVGYYANKVKDAAILRSLIQVMEANTAKAYEMDATPTEVVAELHRAIGEDEVIATIGAKVPTAKDDWPEVFRQLCQSQESEFLGLQTGFDKLDKATSGLRGLSVLGGLPGGGKSSFGLQVATEIARINAVPVLFYALEMSKFDLYIKAISRLSGLDYKTLTIGSEIDGRRGQGLIEEDTHKLSEATNEFMEYADKVRIIDRAVCRDICLPIVRLHVQQVKREFDVDQIFVVIDHLQIFPCDKPGLADMKSRLDYLVAEFKAISEQLNATVLLISEKNRSSYEKEWLGSYMGSAGIEYGVDLAMLIHEKGEEEQAQPIDEDERDLKLKIVKNRFGKRADISMRFYPDVSHFDEIGGTSEATKNK